MIKKELENLDLSLYEETLENGLRIFLVPKADSESIYATFTTDFGGNHTEFIPNGKSDFIKVPDGIAHFLEHKMFDLENGIDVMTSFSKNGVSANASTSYFKTTYLFDGSSHFEENLNLLLDYVQSPYFTDESVEKEKPIIEQEIDMSADNPYSIGFKTLMNNIFINDASKVPVIGTKESINKITKEDLYMCYNTFYHPKNMFLVITGNIDPVKTISIIHKNQEKKKFNIYQKPVLKSVVEPIEVAKKEEEIKMNITVPKITLGYKFDLKLLKEKLKMDSVTIRRYLSIYAALKFGGVSTFLETLRNDLVITSSIDYSTFSTENTLLLILETDTKNKDEFLKRLEKELEKKEIDETLFHLKKKGMIASCVYMSENIYSINQKIMNDIIEDDAVEVDVLNHFKNLNYIDFMKLINLLDFTVSSLVIVNPTINHQ